MLLGATAGTARHSLVLEHALRPLFAYLHADRRADRGVRRQRGLRLAAGPAPARVERAAGELADAVAAPPAARVVDPFEDPTPFEELLRG